MAAIYYSFAELAAELKRRGQLAEKVDWRPALEQVAVAVVADAKRNFDGQHDPDGVPWEPLKQPRRRRRDRRARGGSGQKVLRDTGALMAAATGKGNGEVRLERAAVTVSVNLVYAATHNDGDPSRNIPQRQFLGVGEELGKEIDELVLDYAEDLLLGDL